MTRLVDTTGINRLVSNYMSQNTSVYLNCDLHDSFMTFLTLENLGLEKMGLLLAYFSSYGQFHNFG